MTARQPFYLTYGQTSDGRNAAVCSDGSPQLGHEHVTVLSVEIVKNMKEAKRWFQRVIVEQPWQARN